MSRAVAQLGGGRKPCAEVARHLPAPGLKTAKAPINDAECKVPSVGTKKSTSISTDYNRLTANSLRNGQVRKDAAKVRGRGWAL